MTWLKVLCIETAVNLEVPMKLTTILDDSHFVQVSKNNYSTERFFRKFLRSEFGYYH